MGKHSLSQILLSAVFKDLAELTPREDFGQKNIEMERNLCHLLIPAHPFRTCTSQEKGRHKNTSAGRAYLQQIRRAVFTHALNIAACTGHEAVGDLPWQPEASAMAGCRLHSASISDPNGMWQGSCDKSSLSEVLRTLIRLGRHSGP